MSRSRAGKALIASGFAYINFASAIVTGVLLVPLMLDRLGARAYGLWLASGELLGYVSLLDIGVFSVFPWVIAEAEGRRDLAALKGFVVNGLCIGGALSLVFLLGLLLGWVWLADLVGLPDSDRALLFGPVTVLMVATALTYPLNAFIGALTGLQDFTFTGTAAVAQGVLRAGVTAGLLFGGAGLYALAIGSTAPTVLVLVASAIRVRLIAPELVSEWPRPTWQGVRGLVREGVGGWLAGFGWKLSAASQALVITYVGTPAMVPVFACTGKLTQLLTQLAWALPDGGNVGLAQIHGEGRGERVREVAAAMLRLLLVLSGAIVCVTLVWNRAFVEAWVGSEFFGGMWLNGLFAAVAVASSLAHGLFVVTSVLGLRLRAGIAALISGVVQVVLAVALGTIWGLVGIATALLMSFLLVALPAGASLLRRAVGFSERWLVQEVVWSWIRKVWLLLATAGLGGVLVGSSLWRATLLTVLLSVAYLWRTRSICQELPLPPWVLRWLTRARLTSGADIMSDGVVR
jgi:O-antigen/teichoic acid export membrane protein